MWGKGKGYPPRNLPDSAHLILNAADSAIAVTRAPGEEQLVVKIDSRYGHSSTKQIRWRIISALLILQRRPRRFLKAGLEGVFEVL